MEISRLLQMKLSKRQQEIEARKASDPIAQVVGRTDIDYTDPDQLPTAPRVSAVEQRPEITIESLRVEEERCRATNGTATGPALAHQQELSQRVNYRGTPSQLSPNPDPNSLMDEPDEPNHDLVWGEHLRDGGRHTEWYAPCGCAYHPQPFPHVHPCSDEHKRPDLHGGNQSENT